MTERVVRCFLYVTAGILLAALPCAFLPYAWMDAVHRWLGLGTLPDAPMVLYLARSASALYASIGGLYLYLAADPRRHRDVLRVLGWLKVALGIGLIPIDVSAGLPWFWTAYEGPFVLAWGLALLGMVRSLQPNAATPAPRPVS